MSKIKIQHEGFKFEIKTENSEAWLMRITCAFKYVNSFFSLEANHVPIGRRNQTIEYILSKNLSIYLLTNLVFFQMYVKRTNIVAN